VQSTLIILVVIFIMVNLAADLAYGLLDPRVRRR
jgi:ABC-type dipeptide/oligopeptide/nickel transport system permease component